MAENQEPHDLFDRVFKRLMHLSNTAVVSFINGLFGTNHPLTSKVEYLATEQVDENLRKTNSDMIIGINGSRYVIEFQRKDDNTMAIRIFYYAYSDSLNTKYTDDAGVMVLEFPKATVIYLESTGKTVETLRLLFPGGSEHTFTVPVLNLLEYSIPDLKKQNLQLLLPFYVLKLYDKIKKAKSGDERKNKAPELIALLKEIEGATDTAVEIGSLRDEDTRSIIELLEKVYNHLYKSYDELQEANKMAEKLLELRTDKIIKETWQKAEKATWQKAEQKAVREKQAIASNLRGFGLTDEQIQRAVMF
jgi:hypothetical protein